MYMKKCTKMLAIIISLTLLLLAAGCGKKNQSLDESLVVTVDDSSIYMDEMMYHIMLEEMQGQLYESYLQEENYWETENESGDTIAQLAKETVINNAIQYELFYNLALDNGYSLTDQENQDSIDKAKNIIKSVDPDQLLKAGLDEGKLTEIQKKISLSAKYFNDYKNDIGIDDEAIKAQINPDDYKQYDIEYLFLPTQKINDDGATVSLTQDEKSQAYEQISSYIDSAKTSSDFTGLLNDYENNTYSVKSGAVSFLANKDFFADESEIEDTVIKMSQGETSGVIETQKGYYIVKLISDTSTEQYDAAVKSLISSKENDAIETLKKSHKIKINSKVWKSVTIGKMTINNEK